MSAPKLDPRLYAFRADLADERLRGKVKSTNFVSGEPAKIGVNVANIYARPDQHSPRISQLIFGQNVLVFEDRNGFCWIQSVDDDYVGYSQSGNLRLVTTPASHYVIANRTFAYKDADLKSPVSDVYSMGTEVVISNTVETRGSSYGITASGDAIFMHHLSPVFERCHDYVLFAEKLLHTPYLWGGTSAFGIDCSGLVQLAFRLVGRLVPRDSDMQSRELGVILTERQKLRRGDLVFWKGHVAIMIDATNIIHANGMSMDVCIEPLQDVIERFSNETEHILSMRRP